MSKSGETAKLQALPSEYFRRQCFISVDPDEDQVEWVIQRLGDDTLVFSTDYPHSDSHLPRGDEPVPQAAALRAEQAEDPLGQLRAPLQRDGSSVTPEP